MTPYLLLFDLDGTLMLTDGAGGRAMQAVAAELFGETFTFDGVDFADNLDPLIFAEAARRCRLADHPEHHDRFRSAYVGRLATALLDTACVRVMPGVHELLAELRRREHVVLGLLTGNYGEAATLKLSAARIDYGDFRVTAFGDEAPARPDLVALAIQRFTRHVGQALPPAEAARRVLVIGDTPRDVEAAHAHGCRAVAVATGRHTVDELHACGPDLVLPDLTDPRPILALLDTP